ncbi:hypothetical protein RRG08_065229 [Elysia crispata]|uniref:Uncharacterized protein n=1 Tax=Elysia crispata TaxID=231223 RepID=A0AAE0YIJ1_9GAST|nr:hypothetical protein RRG08_065229 [Elysia crispata]
MKDLPEKVIDPALSWLTNVQSRDFLKHRGQFQAVIVPRYTWANKLVKTRGFRLDEWTANMAVDGLTTRRNWVTQKVCLGLSLATGLTGTRRSKMCHQYLKNDPTLFVCCDSPSSGVTYQLLKHSAVVNINAKINDDSRGWSHQPDAPNMKIGRHRPLSQDFLPNTRINSIVLKSVDVARFQHQVSHGLASGPALAGPVEIRGKSSESLGGQVDQ